MQKLVINFKLPTMNEIIAMAKVHPLKYAQCKKKYTSVIALLARQQLKPITEYPIKIEFHWYPKNLRTDCDNLSSGKKYILDGLVKAGILKNDNYKYFSEFRDIFKVDSKNARVEVMID